MASSTHISAGKAVPGSREELERTTTHFISNLELPSVKSSERKEAEVWHHNDALAPDIL